MDKLKAPGKPFDISKRAVWEAWGKVKANKGAPGVDAVTVAEFATAEPAGVSGIAHDREPVPALRDRHVDGPDVPGRRFRTLRGRRGDPLRQRAPGPRGAGRAPGADERGRAGAASDKTRIVYCQDARRRGSHKHTSFTFLGYGFRGGRVRTKSRRITTGFVPAISKDAMNKISSEVRSL